MATGARRTAGLTVVIPASSTIQPLNANVRCRAPSQVSSAPPTRVPTDIAPVVSVDTALVVLPRSPSGVMASRYVVIATPYTGATTDSTPATTPSTAGLGASAYSGKLSASIHSITTAIRPSGKRFVAWPDSSEPSSAPTAAPVKMRPIPTGVAPTCLASTMMSRYPAP